MATDRELSNKLASGEITQIKIGGTGSDKIVPNAGENDLKYGTKTDVQANTDFRTGPKPVIQFEPQLSVPAHSEGQFYYDSELQTFKAQGPIDGVEVEVGHTMHTHVINNTGAIIEKGMACRHNGVAGGIVQVAKALADTFYNAEIFGIASQDIAAGAEGAITTFGEIRDLDTSGLPLGVPLYLSDTVPGTYTSSPVAILSQVGGAVTQDAITGKLFVSIESNKNVPTVFAGMQGQTPGNETYASNVVVQDINDYLTASTVVIGADLPTGVISLTNTGNYRLHFSAGISFPSSTSTRSVYIEFYDVTNTTALFTYTKNMPRDATEDGFSFSYPFSGTVGNQYKMRIYSNTAIAVTFENVSYDIQSISII